MDEVVGERVGAYIDINTETKVIRFLGYGIFLGCEIPPSEGVGGCIDLVLATGTPNPKIRLDSGKIVWGCECWWRLESEVKEILEEYKSLGFSIVDVDIDEIRQEQLSEE